MARKKQSCSPRTKLQLPANVPSSPLGSPRFGLSPDSPIHIAVHRAQGRFSSGADLHLACELGIVIAGSMQRDHGAGWFEVKAGQAYACPSFHPHQWRFPGRHIKRVVFEFLPSLFLHMPNLSGFDPTTPFRSPTQYGPIGSSRKGRQALADLGRQVATRCATAHPLPGIACVDLMNAVRLVLEGLPQEPARMPTRRTAVFAASRISAALDLLRDAPHRRVSLPEAARVCGMARSTFVKLFKTVTGLSFARFALRWRLSAAAHVLRTTDWPIKAIAEQFGFRYRTHFCRVFAAHYGMPPAQFREAEHQDRSPVRPSRR